MYVRNVKRSSLRHVLVWAVMACCFAFLLVGVTPLAHAADTSVEPVIVEHAISGRPLNIAVEGVGNVWATLPADNQIGHLTVDGQGVATFETFDVPTDAARPYDLALRGNFVWFTEMDGNKLGRLTMGTGAFDEFDLPTANSLPTGIDIAPNGTVWLVQQAGNNLVRFNPNTETFTEFAVPEEVVDSGLADLSVRNNDEIWFTAPQADSVVVYVVSSDKFFVRRTQTPTESYEEPTSVIMDPAGRPWVSSFGSAAVGRYTPETLSFWKFFSAPTDDAQVADLVIRDVGDNWYVYYTEANTNQVGLFLVRESDIRMLNLAEIPLPTSNSRPWGIAVDADGSAWIAESNANVIAEWRPPYYRAVYLPYVLDR